MLTAFDAAGGTNQNLTSYNKQDKQRSLNPFESPPHGNKVEFYPVASYKESTKNQDSYHHSYRDSYNDSYEEKSSLYPPKILMIDTQQGVPSAINQEPLQSTAVVYADSVDMVYFLDEDKPKVLQNVIYSVIAQKEAKLNSSTIRYFLCIYDISPQQDYLRWKADMSQIHTVCLSRSCVCVYPSYSKVGINDSRVELDSCNHGQKVMETNQSNENPDRTAIDSADFYNHRYSTSPVPICLKFLSVQQCEIFSSYLLQNQKSQPSQVCLGGHLSDTEASAVQAYFHYYAKLSNQMNMLQDSVRTKIYQDAILSNITDFCQARVMDIGAGTGVLSFFSAQAGANTVYAVEASTVAAAIPILSNSNVYSKEKIKVIHSTIELLNLQTHFDDEKVDVLVSEPIGTFLFNERMLESYLFARDNFLSPDGKMFPSRYRLYLSPFTDAQLFQDIKTRCNFWLNQNFYGINLSSLYSRAVEEQFRQPVVDYVDPSSLVCQMCHEEQFDLKTISRKSLSEMIFKFSFHILSPCLIHGIAGWFDVIFDGTDKQIKFSTSPWCRPTHWYQMRFVFQQPLAVNANQTVVGSLKMTANVQQSYYIEIDAEIQGTSIRTSTVTIDLKDPDYRYYSNPQASYMPNTQYSNVFGAQAFRTDNTTQCEQLPVFTNNTETDFFQQSSSSAVDNRY